MESLQTILKVIQPGDWFISVDQGCVFPCAASLCLSKISSVRIEAAPLAFCMSAIWTDHITEILLAPVAYLRLQGIRIYHYFAPKSG